MLSPASDRIQVRGAIAQISRAQTPQEVTIQEGKGCGGSVKFPLKFQSPVLETAPRIKSLNICNFRGRQ